MKPYLFQITILLTALKPFFCYPLFPISHLSPVFQRPTQFKQNQLHAMTSTSMKVASYAPAAVSLFNNMKTPASILAGAMVPLGFLSQLPESTSDKSESKFIQMLRKAHILVVILSFCSELLAVMWATVAVNQLTETIIAPSESVWALIQRDFELHWTAVNSHFVIGMFGFMTMILTRTLIVTQNSPFGVKAGSGSIAASALFLMMSIVNRGVASGGGQEGERFGSNVMSLFGRYTSLLFSQATRAGSMGILEICAIALGGFGIVSGFIGVFNNEKEKNKLE